MKRKNDFLSKKVAKHKALLVAISLSVNFATAQLSPANDPSWNLIVPMSNEFNTTLPLQLDYMWYSSGNSNMFCPPNPYDGQPYNDYYSPGNMIANPNILVDAGALHLIATGASPVTGLTPNPLPAPYTDERTWWGSVGNATSQWKTAGIVSNPFNSAGNIIYKYGYFEIRAKLPGYISQHSNTSISYNGTGPNCDYHSPGTGKMTRRGLQALWWFANENPDNTCPSCHKDEVDVMETHPYPGNADYRANTIPTHWFFGECDADGNCHIPADHKTGNFDANIIFNPTTDFMDADLVTTFHKYGFEWMPDRMIFYFDDVPYSVNYNVPGIPQDFMYMQLTLKLEHPGDWIRGIDDLMEFDAPLPAVYDPNSPMQFVIDYFHYYQINTANCNVDYTINNNTDLDNFPNEVRQNVTVAASTVMNAYSSKIVRHSGDFTVPYGVDFEVPLGTDLAVMPTPCQ